jgi:fluoride exporter
MSSPSWFASTVLIALGGGLGSGLRWWLDRGVRAFLPSLAPFPIGILVVNVAGCLVFGLLIGRQPEIQVGTRLLWLTGFMGGLTTFSTFGGDSARLLLDGRIGLALLNAIGSVTLGIGAAALGMWLAGPGGK